MRTPEQIKNYIDREWARYKKWDTYSAITVELLCNIALTLNKLVEKEINDEERSKGKKE